MSVKYKLMLAADTLILAALLIFAGLLYTSEKRLLWRQSGEAQEHVLESLSKVASESILSEDDITLVNYTANLKRTIGELASASVADDRTILAHTDKTLVRSPLSALKPGKDVRLLSRTVPVNGRDYRVTVGYSEPKVREAAAAALDAVAARIAKAGALAVLGATLLSLWFSRLFTRPVKKLVQAFRLTAEGDLTFKLHDVERQDEIGALNRGFNEMTSRLRELDELKKDFVSSVTHELKSPLGAIESYLNLIAYDLANAVDAPQALAAKIPKFLEDINCAKQNSGRLRRFISDLLDAARIEKGKFEIVKTERDRRKC